MTNDWTVQWSESAGAIEIQATDVTGHHSVFYVEAKDAAALAYQILSPIPPKAMEDDDDRD